MLSKKACLVSCIVIKRIVHIMYQAGLPDCLYLSARWQVSFRKSVCTKTFKRILLDERRKIVTLTAVPRAVRRTLHSNGIIKGRVSDMDSHPCTMKGES